MARVDPAVAEMIADEPSLAWFGFSIDEASEGKATVTAAVGVPYTNGHGAAHGGFVFALADQAFAMAAISRIGPAVTADAQIHYLAPARLGDTLIAEAHVTWHDARRAIVDVAVSADGQTLATYRGAARAVRPR